MGIAHDIDEFDELKDENQNTKNLLIEGDSWVSHPQMRNYSDQFEVMGNDNIDILNIASPGDTMLNIMNRHGNQIKTLEKIITDPVFSYKWDAIFLSAMGNDIIGPEIRYFIEDKNDNPGLYGRELLNGFFKRVLSDITEDYKHFIKMVRTSTKNATTPIITHSYCYLEPRQKGTVFLGIKLNKGWIKVYLEDKNIDEPEEQTDLVKGLLTACYEAMKSIDDDKFLVVDTRELLMRNGKPDTSLFHDEIHPSSKGFEIITKKIIEEATNHGFWL